MAQPRFEKRKEKVRLLISHPIPGSFYRPISLRVLQIVYSYKKKLVEILSVKKLLVTCLKFSHFLPFFTLEGVGVEVVFYLGRGWYGSGWLLLTSSTSKT